MGNKSSGTSLISATVLIIVNFIVLVFCVTIFGLCLWRLSSSSSFHYALHIVIRHPEIKMLLITEELSVQSTVGIALLTLFIFVISFMGLYGAIIKSPFLLLIYAMISLLLLLLECSLFYYFTSNVTEKGIREEDGHWSHALRLGFDCCEKNITNIVNSPELKVPWSCCMIKSMKHNCNITEIRSKKCSHEISNWIHKYQTAVYATLATLHIVLLSCSLMRRSRIKPSLSHR